MFAVTVTFQIKPDQMNDFMLLMKANARTSRAVEAGCHQFDICRSGNRVFLYEIYDDRAAFDLHLQSNHFKTFDVAVASMMTDKQVSMFEEVIQ